jgi:Lon protease-like protein
MNQFLPLFPLQIVVFPGEGLNLHIFEPRYKQLIKDCEREGVTFGIPSYIGNKLMTVGTEVELLKVEKKYDNGEVDIRSRGLRIFNIEKYYAVAPDKLYAGADIQPLVFEEEEDIVENEKILVLARELFNHLEIKKSLPDDVTDFKTWDIGHHIGLKIEQEFELLQLLRSEERQAFIIAHLKQILPVVKDLENLKVKAQMNGHFKHLKPPIV